MVERRLERVWPYDSVSRRRTRALWRVADAAARARSTRPAILPAYWWDGHPNFGDALTPWVLARYGIVAVHTPASRAPVVGIGSLIEQLPETFDGMLWGTGMLYGESVVLPHAEPLAVRGPLTRDALGLRQDVVLGDPGLLVGRFASRRPPRWRLGVVPHGMHEDDPKLHDLVSRSGGEATLVDVRWSPSRVIRRIARCETVLTTSLHGLVVADALGIPAAWTRREPQLWGGDFKFRDYEAVMNPRATRETEVSPGSTIAGVVASAEHPHPGARAETIRTVEETIGHLAVTHAPLWRSLAIRDR